MTFRNIRALVDAMDGGASSGASIRKIPSQASVAGMFVDLSMAAGNPKPQYYASAPFEAATLDGSEGILHGFDKSPDSMYVTEVMLITSTAGMVGRYILADYLMYYPFIELDNLDEQVMDNTVTLPRYSDGAGVRVMMVAQAPTAGAEQFTYSYVNQDGIAKTSPVQLCSSSVVNIASVPTSQPATVAGQGPFLTLADGDTGVRSITGVTVTAGGGGLAALVLMKPLTDLTIFEVNTPSEMSAVTMRGAMPRVYDGAYLGLINQCAGSVAAGQLMGRINYAWG